MLLIPPNSELGKELAKWNKPYVFEPFPQMLYKAIRKVDGVVACVDAADPAVMRQTTKIVRSEEERQRAFEAGWRANPKEALALLEAREVERGNEAAHRAYEDRNMSDKAKAEAKAADDASIEHVAEVPEAPRKRKYTRHTTAAA